MLDSLLYCTHIAFMFVYIFSCFFIIIVIKLVPATWVNGWLASLASYARIRSIPEHFLLLSVQLASLPIYYTINRFQFLMIFLFVIFFSSLVDLAKTLLTKLIHNNDIFRLFLVVHFFLLASPKTISGFLFGIYSQLCVNKYYLYNFCLFFSLSVYLARSIFQLQIQYGYILQVEWWHNSIVKRKLFWLVVFAFRIGGIDQTKVVGLLHWIENEIENKCLWLFLIMHCLCEKTRFFP